MYRHRYDTDDKRQFRNRQKDRQADRDTESGMQSDETLPADMMDKDRDINSDEKLDYSANVYTLKPVLKLPSL